MSNPVLLGGYLDSVIVSRAQAEILQCVKNHQAIDLVIDSDGGNIIPSLELINTLECVKTHIRQIKIYKALSCAALVATSISVSRTIYNSSGNVFAFHRGNLTLEAEDINLSTGVVSPYIMTSFRKYTEMLNSTFDIFGLRKDNQKMAQFYASGWLYLTVPELRYFNMIENTF